MKEVQTGIYVIENKVTGDQYVGSSVNIAQRRHGHFYDLKRGKHKNPHLQAAYDYYGVDAFGFHVLLLCNKRTLLCNEQFFIDLLQPHYNINPNATNSTGRRMSEETKEKLRQMFTGRTLPAEWRQHIGEGGRGKKQSEETRRKIGASHTGRVRGPLSDEHREKVRQGLRGRVFTEEHRRKIGEANKRRVFTPEIRENISRANRGRTLTDEQKRDISTRMTGKKRGHYKLTLSPEEISQRIKAGQARRQTRLAAKGGQLRLEGVD